MKNAVIASVIISIFCFIVNSTFAQKTGVEAILEGWQKETQKSTQALYQSQQDAWQKEQQQKEKESAIFSIVLDIFKALLGRDEDEPTTTEQNDIVTETARDMPEASDILGVWEGMDYLVFIDKYGRYWQQTGNYNTTALNSNVTFSGTYELSGNTFGVFNTDKTLVQTFKIRMNEGRTLILTSLQTNQTFNLTYQSTIEEYNTDKAAKQENLKANVNTFVTSQQGYVTSGQIRNSVNYADTRRSYNEELTKAKSNLQFFQNNFGSDPFFKSDIKKWEEKVAQLEQDIKRLDKNADN